MFTAGKGIMPQGLYRLHTKLAIFLVVHNIYIQTNATKKIHSLTFFSYLYQSKIVFSAICSTTYITFFIFSRKPLGVGTVFY